MESLFENLRFLLESLSQKGQTKGNPLLLNGSESFEKNIGLLIKFPPVVPDHQGGPVRAALGHIACGGV